MTEQKTTLNAKTEKARADKEAQSWIGKLPGGKWILGIIGLITISAGVLSNLDTIARRLPEIDERRMPAQGRVIMVTPTSPPDHFGVLHKEGLEKGLAPTILGSPHVIGGDGTIFKRGQLDEPLAKLKSELAKNDVVAVVAPSITEATEEVIEIVHETGDPIPVIIESSVPWDALHRFRDGPPLFRLSSGIGERGREIGAMVTELATQDLEIWLFVEQVPNKRSYGVLMQDHILRTDGGNLIPGHRRVFFDQGNPEKSLEAIPFNRSDVVVFMLSLGSDFAKIIKRLYKGESDTAARIVGVMTAYKIPSIVDIGNYKDHLVFDITDLDTRPGIQRDLDARRFYENYKIAYGAPNPTHRDQAFSFDVALLLDRSFDESLYGLRYVDGLRKLTSNMAKTSVTGVTGRVTFSNPRNDMKIAYQNSQPNLQVVNYDASAPAERKWISVNWRLWSP